MVYKLDEADKLCGVTYIDWSKKYSPIPKATCEMLKQQCGSGGGSDNTPELSCEDVKKLLKGEDKPKEEKPKEDKPKENTPKEGNKEETPKENETPKGENPKEDKPKEDKPKENDTPGETNPPKEENPNDNTGGNPTEDKEKPKEPPVLTDEELENIIPKLSNDSLLGKYKVTPKNKLIGVEYPNEDTITEYKKEITDKAKGIPELEGYTVEVIVDKIPSPEPKVGEPLNQAPLYTKIIKITKPDGKVYQTEPMNIGTSKEEKEEEFSILEVMPKVEGNFSVITHKDGLVKSITENSPEKKREFEDSVITYLKSKLPEGATVEAVLGEPFYKEGSELITGRTNYTLNVRVTINGKVYEQVYNVPHIEEEESVVTNPDEPELDLDKVRIFYPNTFKFVIFDEMPDRIGAFELEKPGDLERARDEILANLNDESLNPQLKDFKKKVVLYRDRTTMPKVGDNPFVYGNEISPEFMVTLVSPGGKVYRTYIPTTNGWLYTSQELYNRGK